MQKLYCYVDETGQDKRSTSFLVSVIVTEAERDSLIALLEAIERSSGKGHRKWMDARDSQKVEYITQVLSTPAFRHCLTYEVHPLPTNFLQSTILTTAKAILRFAKADYKATVFIDGLPKSQIATVGSQLRQLHVRTEKVRGVRKEEANALIRLADALCGFVRAALEGRSEFQVLLEKAKQEQYITEL